MSPGTPGRIPGTPFAPHRALCRSFRNLPRRSPSGEDGSAIRSPQSFPSPAPPRRPLPPPCHSPRAPFAVPLALSASFTFSREPTASACLSSPPLPPRAWFAARLGGRRRAAIREKPCRIMAARDNRRSEVHGRRGQGHLGKSRTDRERTWPNVSIAATS
jgi:hypothetical protein